MRILDGMSISNQDKKPTLFGIYSRNDKGEGEVILGGKEIFFWVFSQVSE